MGPLVSNCQVPFSPGRKLVPFLVHLGLFLLFKYRTLEITNPLSCSFSLIFVMGRKSTLVLLPVDLFHSLDFIFLGLMKSLVKFVGLRTCLAGVGVGA